MYEVYVFTHSHIPEHIPHTLLEISCVVNTAIAEDAILSKVFLRVRYNNGETSDKCDSTNSEIETTQAVYDLNAFGMNDHNIRQILPENL